MREGSRIFQQKCSLVLPPRTIETKKVAYCAGRSLESTLRSLFSIVVSSTRLRDETPNCFQHASVAPYNQMRRSQCCLVVTNSIPACTPDSKKIMYFWRLLTLPVTDKRQTVDDIPSHNNPATQSRLLWGSHVHGLVHRIYNFVFCRWNHGGVQSSGQGGGCDYEGCGLGASNVWVMGAVSQCWSVGRCLHDRQVDVTGTNSSSVFTLGWGANG